MAALPPIQGGAAQVKPPTSSSVKPATSLPLNPGTTQDVSAKGANLFEQLIAKTNQDQQVSDQAIEDLVTGKNDDVQQVVMQVVKSEMSFQLFMEIRNQLIESYNELMRMQF